MYVWMILATFVAILAAFNLSPRNDIRQVQSTPLAEAAITKFLVVHDAAVRYARKKVSLQHQNPQGEVGLSAGSITGCTKNGDNYTGNLCGFLPIGFKFNDDSYTTKAYCLNSAEYDYSEDEEGNIIQTVSKVEGTEDGYDCNDVGHHAVYIVSYGPIPPRWRNVASNRILPEYYYAMRSKIAVGSSCGIVAKKTVAVDERNRLNSDYVIEGIDVKNNSIPLKVIQDNDFASQCLQWNDSLNGFVMPCIIYVTAL